MRTAVEQESVASGPSGGRPVALITGARRGIGRAIGVAMAAAGHDIAFTDLSEAAEASTAFAAAGAAVLFLPHDVGAVATHEALVERVRGHFGRLDCFVSNAGIGAPLRGDLLDLSPEHYDRVMAVNQRGAVFLSQAVARAMLDEPAKGPRSLIFITSVSAAALSIERTDYCLSKAGLALWARALAVRLAADNIGVFDVRPGIIRTEMTAAVAESYTRRIEDGLVPARRWGEAEDIARIVAGLATGAFGFATGSIIDAGGGLAIPRL